MKYPETLKQVIKGKSRVQAAFSLIELLVVIAVIGIIAAIAIPNIGNLTGGATVAKDQRNAQNLASVFSAARAAGNDADYSTAAAAVTALVDTGLTGLGTPASTFQVPNLAPDEQTGALRYLTLINPGTNSQLLYSQTASTN